MNELTCPHCFGRIPYGALVCRGCHAELEYGAPSYMFWILFAVSALAGGYVNSIVPSSVDFFGWVIGIICFAIGYRWIKHLFCNKVYFKRYYRT